MEWNPLSHFYFLFLQIQWFNLKVEKKTRDETMMMNYCNNLIVCVCVYFSCEAHYPPC